MTFITYGDYPVPRGVYERKPRKPKTTPESVKPTKVKKTRATKTDKIAKPEKIKKMKEPKIKKVKQVESDVQVSDIPKLPVQVERSWLKPIPFPAEVEFVDIKDIAPELRASVSVFHEEGVSQFVRMMFRKYGIKKFTKAVAKNSGYYFYYEEPLLAGRKK
jgi:hypothetical protein